MVKGLRRLDFLQLENGMHAEVPLFVCSNCGKTSQADVPWASEGSGFTALFEALALSLWQELPVRQAAALLRCSDKQLWRRIAHNVGLTRALDAMSQVEIVGIDETSLRRGQIYITVVNDLDLKCLLFACVKRKPDVRAKEEHSFRVFKHQFGLMKASFRNLRKNTTQLVALFARTLTWT